MITLPDYSDKSKLIDFLIENKSALIAQKKASIKQADAISYNPYLVRDNGVTVKAESSQVSNDLTKIKVRSIINTTKLFDSHGDVHIDQLWNKSLKETKDHYLVNQHDFSFEGIISDNVKAFAKQYSWAELGYPFEGQTQALVFDSVIDKNESPIMFDRYAKGKVKNHSVGMRYVKVAMAVNDDRYKDEYAVWNKYIDQIANLEDVMDAGYFFAVTEAKVIEGSAVVKGSNYATPTMSIESTKELIEEPLKDTPFNEPANATQLLEALKKLNEKIKI